MLCPKRYSSSVLPMPEGILSRMHCKAYAYIKTWTTGPWRVFQLLYRHACFLRPLNYPGSRATTLCTKIRKSKWPLNNVPLFLIQGRPIYCSYSSLVVFSFVRKTIDFFRQGWLQISGSTTSVTPCRACCSGHVSHLHSQDDGVQVPQSIDGCLAEHVIVLGGTLH